MPAQPFQLPVAYDLAAVLVLAVAGALEGLARRYDLVGVAVLALATALAGGVLRDLLLQRGPPAALVDGRYLTAALVGAAAVAVLRARWHRLGLLIALLDALGLGIYGVVGAQKALAAGLPVPSALLIGTINAVGGSVVRDVLVRQEPVVFKPGAWYALCALAGCATFALLVAGLAAPPQRAAAAGIAVAFTTRVLSMRLGWRTGAVGGDRDR